MTHNQIEYAKHKENVRHNKRSEKQTDRSIRETVRHNKKSEQIGQANVNLGYANVGLGYSNLGELYRHNAQTEIISQQQLDEAKRHNVAAEITQENANVAKTVAKPWGYVLYTANKNAATIANTVVKGFNNLADATKERLKSPAFSNLNSSGIK